MDKKLVTGRKISEKLKRLGVKQKSEFCWVKYLYKDKYKWDLFCLLRGKTASKNISAFLVGELGEMLTKIDFTDSIIFDKSSKWRTAYCDNAYKHPLSKATWADTEANSRGKMLIYLLENKLIKNKR